MVPSPIPAATRMRFVWTHFARATLLVFLAVALPLSTNAGEPTTETIEMQEADFFVLPLFDAAERKPHVHYTYEVRQYARAAISALVASAGRFRERDSFTVDSMLLQMNHFPKEPLAPEMVRAIAGMLAVRCVVQPILRQNEDGALVASLTVMDIQNDQQATTITKTGPAGEHAARAAQDVLLEAAFPAAEALLARLEKPTTFSAKAAATPPDSKTALAAAEALLANWDLHATREALELAGEAISRQPADPRAWAMAARCWARWADDTRQYPARFHRECRLRATVAADIARRLDPEDPDVRFAAACALRAARRLVEAEAIFTSFTEHPKYSTETLAALANIRYRPGMIPAAARHTSGSIEATTIPYLYGRALAASDYDRESLETFHQLLDAEPQNILFAARHSEARSQAAHPNYYLRAGAYHALLAMSQSFSDLLPAVWDLGEPGQRIARVTLEDLQASLGTSVTADLADPADVARFRQAMDFMSGRPQASLMLRKTIPMAPNNPLFRLMKTHSQMEAALTDCLVKTAPPASEPLGLSLLDRLRLHDRLIVEALGEVLLALHALGVQTESRRFAGKINAAFLGDEAAQIIVGMHVYRSLYFNPRIVTQHFDQARTAWWYYVPQAVTRAWWAVPHEPLDKVAKRYRGVLAYDLFDPAVAATIAARLAEIRQWDDAATVVRKAIDGDPYRLDLQQRRLLIERGKTRKQISTESIAQLARDFRHRPEIDETVASLYYAAGHVEEAVQTLRDILESDPGNQDGFFRLVNLLRYQGKDKECEDFIEAFVRKHPDLYGNRAVCNALEYYISCREYDRATSFARTHGRHLDPSTGGAMTTMGRLLWLTGQRERARAEFERYFARYGGVTGPRRLAELEAVGGNWKEMLQQGLRLQKAVPRTRSGYWLEALYHLHDGVIPLSERAAGTGLTIAVHSPDAYAMFAKWHYYRGDFAHVLKDCKNGRRYVKGSHHKDLDVMEVRARLQSGDTEGVATIVQRLRLFDPLDAWTHICEALWHIRERNFAAARKALAPARRFNPRNTYVQVAHARILLAAGKTDEAVEELRFAADHVHAPEDRTEPLYYLGRALLDAGKPDEAKQAYARLLELWPVGYWADEAKKGIQQAEAAGDGGRK